MTSGAGADRFGGLLIRLAVRVLPARHRDRYTQEFVAEIYGMPRAEQVRHALQVLAFAWTLRTALSEYGSATIEEETMIKIARRSWRCALRVHFWEQHQNPETRELFEVCSRCDAYRDRGNAAPGAGAAGVTGAGIG